MITANQKLIMACQSFLRDLMERHPEIRDHGFDCDYCADMSCALDELGVKHGWKENE